MLIWPTVCSVDSLTQEIATFMFHLHLPLSATCVDKDLSFFLCDKDFSSTAECRLSLHMSQLLYEWQLRAGAACKPLPFLNTACWDLKGEKKKSISILLVFSVVVPPSPPPKRQNKLKVIKTSTFCTVTRALDLAHLDTASEPT